MAADAGVVRQCLCSLDGAHNLFLDFCAVQVVRTTVEPLTGKHPGVHYDAYEYLANHHSYKRDEHPTVKITYNLSPLQVRREGCCGTALQHPSACLDTLCFAARWTHFSNMRAAVVSKQGLKAALTS